LAAQSITHEIDGMAGLLTGDRTFFWSKGGTLDEAGLANHHRWRRIEAGEEPWPK
jgi:hypothetical protein